MVQVTELNEKVPLFANFSISEQICNLYNVATNRMQMSIQVRKGYEYHDEHDEKKHFPVAGSVASAGSCVLFWGLEGAEHTGHFNAGKVNVQHLPVPHVDNPGVYA